MVFAHGMELDHRLFVHQIHHFKKTHRVVAYNLRARTSKGESPYSLYDLVDDLISLLDKLEIHKCVLVGMSMGGFTAIRAAYKHPERFHALILFGSAGVPYPASEIAKWAPVYEALMPLPVLGKKHARDDALLHFSKRSQRLHPELVEQWTDIIATRTGKATVYEFKSWGYQDDLRPHLSSMKVPAMIIQGDEDIAVPLDMAEETHRLLPDCRLMVVPFAAHGVNLEYPDKCNAAIDMFLEELALREN